MILVLILVLIRVLAPVLMHRVLAPVLSGMAALAVLTLFAAGVCQAADGPQDSQGSPHAAPHPARAGHVRAVLARLEQAHGVRTGLAARNLATGERLGYREDEPFAFCSVFKVHLVARILQMAEADDQGEDLLAARLHWTADEELGWSPETRGRGKIGMSVLELCRAAIRSSDNTAANVLLHLAGGPARLTEAARALGDKRFCLADQEPALNQARLPEGAEPGAQPFNTTTPKSLLAFLETVLEGDALGQESRDRLMDMLGEVLTGEKRILAALPEGHRLFHKTGTGERQANDAGLVVNERGERLFLAVFVEDAAWARKGGTPDTGSAHDLARLEEILARAASLVFEETGFERRQEAPREP